MRRSSGSGWTPEQKVRYVTDALVPKLTDDLRSVFEMRCKEHGAPGACPDYTACVLGFVVCETLGMLFGSARRPPAEWFLCEVGRVAGNSKYGAWAPLLVAFFRNGIAHTFLPTSVSPLTGVVVWFSSDDGRTTCLDVLSTEAGRPRLDRMRRDHLQTKALPGVAKLRFVPQAFVVDLLRTIDEYVERLRVSDPEVVENLSRNFEEWYRDNTTLRGPVGAALSTVIEEL